LAQEDYQITKTKRKQKKENENIHYT